MRIFESLLPWRSLRLGESISSSYAWLLIGLLWGVAFLTSAGRSTLIAVMPQLRAEFGLSATQLALVNSAAFWIYAVGAFLFGRLGDGTRRSRLIVGGLVFWSVATGLGSLATGFALLILARGLVAVGEATYYPTGTALISDWHRTSTRGRALSVHQTGVLAGAGGGALCTGLIADSFDWRVPFAVLGVLGLVIGAVLFKWLRDAPLRRPSALPADEPASTGPLRTVLRRPPALYICMVFFLASGASAGLMVWAPTYLHDTLDLDLAGSAFYGYVTSSIAGLIFVPIGGLLAERLAARTPLGAYYVLAIGLAFAGVLLLPLAVASSAGAVGSILARATAVGLMTMIGFGGAGLAPIFVAQASEATGMAAAMTSMSVLYMAAAVLLFATRASARRTVLETRAGEESHS